jgi:hypothetical protein
LRDPPISIITGAKWTEGMVQAVEHLLYKGKAPKVQTPDPTTKKAL